MELLGTSDPKKGVVAEVGKPQKAALPTKRKALDSVEPDRSSGNSKT
jgi:hypothetical protein